ncbi:NK-tumor recognition protein isoform X1 [Cynocephalus volans]|uniref:NK-tumor recognition protein isoform X1 n=2 Tax=Cynocephalus volans TaxID=110931 RepID=UPI002FC9E51F
MGAQDRPQCHFDIEINREPVGRIMFQLFSDICPKTCKNFLCLCSGEKGLGKTTGKKLCYKGSTFHRVVKNFMIQGGDFSEGNGKGGESIYGGFFKDENFILKHDRAFLLSMANRGKHTNGSQFFITTKPAPHLDGVHVVFGLVISGFEIIKQIENLKTDAASRPYADVRVIDCGVLATKSTKDVFEKKRKKPTHSEGSDSSSNSSSSSESSSESEIEHERSRRRKHKRRPKVKHSKKRRKEASSSEEPRNKHTMTPKGHSERSDTNEKRSIDSNAKREKPVVRPEEIPPVPENRFLLRRDMPVVTVEPEPKIPDVTPVSDQKPSVSKSGRKIKGRGTIRYHTPPRSRSCSESDDDDSSETPPHWKEEMQRLRVYRPPSGEKWSKGDKLSDPCSSRWDERSLSQRSRSWSYNGYYSDVSTARHSDSHHKKRRKEKKVKHKKKAKKQKHFRRHKQTKKRRTVVPSDVESSKSSTRPPCDRERRSRSSSLSSHHSSKRDWSKSDKDDQSSSTHSSRDSYRSKSHSQSYSRGSSRSRTASKSSSHSPSRSKSRSSSKSGHKRTASKSPRTTTSQLSENKPVKTEPSRAAVPQNENVVVQPVIAENIPVIPLSDSPPPSRWKPGQKPWKPSYERIQEMKAKTTHLLPIQSTYSLANIKETGSSSSYHKREKNSQSDRSAYSKYSDRSSESSPRSRSRSSRSRSYSRSYTRSRSLVSSHSRSRSPSSRSHSRNKYSDHSQCSRSSSYTSVSSDDRRRAKRKSRSSGKKNNTSNKRHSSSSEKTLHSKYVEGRDKSSCQRKYSESRSSLDYFSESEQSSVQITQSAQEKEKQGQKDITNSKKEKNRDEEKSKPERECLRSKKRTSKENLSDHFRNGSKPKRKNYAGSKWDSESNSERGVTKNNRNDSRPSSDKEEGEATSDSESEVSEIHTKAKPTTKSSANTSLPGDNGAWKSSRMRSSASDSEDSYSNSENNRGKLLKHKHGSKENLKREHTKKMKEKLKGKKDKKHKAPKRKQAFHWQPPLEFGEEEEEEINEKQITQESKEKKQVSENSETIIDNPKTEKSCEEGSISSKHNTITVSSDLDHLTKDDSKLNISPTVLNTEENVAISPPNIQHIEEDVPSGVEDVLQTDDNMEICTPDRNSPAKVEGASPLGNSRLDSPDTSIVLKQDMQTEHPEAAVVQQESGMSESKTMGEKRKQEGSSASLANAVESTGKKEVAEKSQINVMDNKWKPLQGVGNLAAPAATIPSAVEVKASTTVPEMKPQGLRIEIKSKNKVRPGSLFDEVRKTARLNRRPRNQESSSDEQTPSRDGDSQSRSPSRSRSKSETKSRHRTRSVSYSHSRSRSRSSTSSYRSRSYSRSRSRGWYSRGRTRSRSSSYRSYKSHRTSSRSRSRSSSYDPHSRSSRSYTYDSYYSRSRSRSRSQRSDSYHKGRSYNRRSRSCRSYGSDSESDRSYSHHRSPSESSRYS